jgi:hypothetical protein
VTSTFAKLKKQAIVEKPKKTMMFSQVQKYLSYATFVGKNVQK